jgi:hypothetical protein
MNFSASAASLVMIKSEPMGSTYSFPAKSGTSYAQNILKEVLASISFNSQIL